MERKAARKRKFLKIFTMVQMFNCEE